MSIIKHLTLIGIVTIGQFIFPVTASAQSFFGWSTPDGPFGYSTKIMGVVMLHDGSLVAATALYGMFRSDDSGTTWDQIIPTSAGSHAVWHGMETAILDLAVDSNDVIFSSAGYSLDKGGTWISYDISMFASDLYVDQQNHLYLIDPEQGIFYSEDVTADFQKLPFPNDVIPESIIRSQDGQIFVASDRGVYRSLDNGISWDTANTGLTTHQATALAIDSSGTLLVGTADKGVFSMSDGDDTWNPVNTGCPTADVQDIAVAEDGTIYVAVLQYRPDPTGLLRSTDGGLSWSKPVFVTGAGIPYGIYPIRGNTLFLSIPANDLFRSPDRGEHWYRPSFEFGTSTINALLVTGDSTILAGTRELGLYKSTDIGAVWNRIGNGLPDVSITSLARVRNGTIFATTLKGLYRSDNEGTDWSRITGGLDADTVWQVAATDENHLLVRTATGTFITHDGGGSWSEVTEFDDVDCLGASYNGVFYAGANDGFLRSTDFGETWRNIFFLGQLSITAMNIDTADRAVAFATEDGAVAYAAGPALTDWYAVSNKYSVPYPIRAITFADPSVKYFGRTIKAGTDRGGVYMSLAGPWQSPQWNSENSGLKANRICAMASLPVYPMYPQGGSDYIIVGTVGHGIARGYFNLTVGVEEEKESDAEGEYPTIHIQPNPFTTATEIHYDVPKAGRVSLGIYNELGREVVRLIDGEQMEAGRYSAGFTAGDLATGTYLVEVRLERAGVVRTRSIEQIVVHR